VPWNEILRSGPVLALVFAHFTNNCVYYTLLSCLPVHFRLVLRFNIIAVRSTTTTTTTNSAGLAWVQRQANSRNRPTARSRKRKNLLSFGCDFSVWHSFGKIVKSVATRCQYFKAKMHQIRFGRGSAPDPAGGAYSAPQTR